MRHMAYIMNKLSIVLQSVHLTVTDMAIEWWHLC